MDSSKIDELLARENVTFRISLQAAIDQTIARRHNLRAQLLDMLTESHSEEMTEEEFFASLETLKKFLENLEGVLQQAGFNDEIVSAWFGKKVVLSDSFRKPLLQIIIAAVLDQYAEVGPLQEMCHFSAEWSRGVLPPFARGSKLPLERKVAELAIWKDLGTRVKSIITFNGIVLLGEVLALTEVEWLRTPNFGYKSLNELNEALKQCFGVAVGCLSEADRALYVWMADARLRLNGAAGKLLQSSSEVKPEYKNLGWDDLRKKIQGGEEVYVQISVDSKLIETLKQAGIVYKTQLATAPQNIITQVCSGHPSWPTQLCRLLLLYSSEPRYPSLQLQTKIPPHLNEDVTVYDVVEQ